MRNLGGILVLVGVLGFFYAGAQLDKAEPLPPGTSVSDSLSLPAGRWELVRYGCAGAALLGVLLALFPKGR
jgi:hypothetical protein